MVLESSFIDIDLFQKVVKVSSEIYSHVSYDKNQESDLF